MPPPRPTPPPCSLRWRCVVSDSYVAALLVERDGYVLRGLSGRVAEVDAELARFGVRAGVVGSREAAVDAPEVEQAVEAAPVKRTRRG
ncbi:MAG: hypothetical protein IPG97_16120 [Microthrixaceae bacterium]|nr:hypothetical protein [Microthrixaceae bacterium]